MITAMRMLSFRHKILFLLVSCLCIAQMTSMFATLNTVGRTVRESVSADLLVAGRTFDQLLEQRYYQLSESVRTLAGEAAFRTALVSHDAPAIVSALQRHAERAPAAFALVLGPDAAIAASTVPADTWVDESAWSALRERIARDELVFAAVTLEGRHYQIVTAPAGTGWVMMGLRIDAALALEFRNLAGVEVSIYDPLQVEAGNLVSTLAPGTEYQLVQGLRKNRFPGNEDGGAEEVLLGDDSFLARMQLLPGSSTPLYAIVQKSLHQEMLPYEALGNNLTMLFAGALLVAVLASIGIGGNIIAPVRRLATLAERIGAGDYGVQIRIDSDDEIGQLGSALNAMQQEIARRERLIIHQTQYDDLTGLPNRYLARERVEQALGRARDAGTRFTAVMLDVSRFKKINDTLGHHIGDVLLKEMSTRLLRRQRKSDTVARMGGDEFLLVLEDTALDAALQLLRDELLPQLTAPHQLEGGAIGVKVNCGLAEYPAHAGSAVELLRRCEIALDEAKARRTGLAVYEPGRDERHLRELAIVSDFDFALAGNQLRLCYQPQLLLDTGEIRHVEALVRWQHPVFGFLPPDEFIGILEQTGNIHKLTEWVIAEAARQCRQWLERGIDVAISVNLSALDLLEPALYAHVDRCLYRYGLDSRHLVLEITESVIMQDQDAAFSVLKQLQGEGFRIAIDDFGTGYSSLAQLKQLPVCELKIDKGFVLDLSALSQHAVIVKSTIELAHAMHLEVVAEGVETEEALRLLQAFGCDSAQGHFIGKPMAGTEFENWYRANHERFVRFRKQAA